MKVSGLIGFAFFKATPMSTYDESSCRNKRMIYLSRIEYAICFHLQMISKRIIFLSEQDQVTTWLHQVVKVQLTTIISYYRCFSWVYNKPCFYTNLQSKYYLTVCCIQKLLTELFNKSYIHNSLLNQPVISCISYLNSSIAYFL